MKNKYKWPSEYSAKQGAPENYLIKRTYDEKKCTENKNKILSSKSVCYY